nr:MAG TPA: hypothetical protein [Caudoviricetes sp.]
MKFDFLEIIWYNEIVKRKELYKGVISYDFFIFRNRLYYY